MAYYRLFVHFWYGLRALYGRKYCYLEFIINKPIMNMSTQHIGNVGENVACKYLKSKGFNILARNYRRKWGELDIVGIKDSIIHFFEVKSVTFDPKKTVKSHKAEENVHGFKVRQIRRMIETYLSETNRGLDAEFCFHVICVYLNMNSRHARVKWMRNMVL